MKKSLLLATLSLLFSLLSSQPLLSQDLETLQRQLTSEVRSARIHAAKTVFSSGILAPEIYATINGILLANLGSPLQEKTYIDEMAWMCKALAASGDPAYRKTLNKVFRSTSNNKLRLYARQSLDRLPYYAERLQQINQPNSYGEEFVDEEVRIANMLRSDLAKLKKDGAKKLIRSGTTNMALYDIAEEELKMGYRKSSYDREHVDTMAWLCKALAASGNAKYANTLHKVATTSFNGKLQKYAKKYYRVLRTGNIVGND